MISTSESIEPIVPLGPLVSFLNCTLTWKGSSMTLVHPRKGEVEVKLIEGCPHVSRQTALDLISELEDHQDGIKLRALDYHQENDWLQMLIQRHPTLRTLPEEIKKKLAVPIGEWTDLPGNRRSRRRWMRDGIHAHLYAGPNEGYTLTEAWKQKGGSSETLLEIDILRGPEHDTLTDNGAYAGLLRVAIEGKLHSVIAGPNCRTRSVLRNYPTGHEGCPRPVRS